MRTHLHACALACAITTVATAADKPNILVIWGDDIGWSNLSCKPRGVSVGL